MRTRRLTRAAALGLALAALAAPTAFAQQDLRGPDAQDAARAALGLTPPAQDLRNPDTRDIGRPHFAAVSLTARTPVTGDHSDDGDSRIVLALALTAIAGTAIVAARRVPRRRLAAALADGTRDWRRGAGL